MPYHLSIAFLIAYACHSTTLKYPLPLTPFQPPPPPPSSFPQALEENKERHEAATIIACMLRKTMARQAVREVRYQKMVEDLSVSLAGFHAAAEKIQR